MKILFYGTYPDQGIGYSKIANKLTNFLGDKEEINLYYFGISNFIESKDKVKRYISKKIKFIDAYVEEKKLGTEELYGVNIFTKYVKKIKPDIVFIYNDLVVTCRLFNEMIKYYETNEKNFKVYTYIDLVYEYERLDMLNMVFNMSDKIFVFTDFWKEHLNEIFVKNDKIRILYHGIEKDIIKRVNPGNSKKICGIEEDTFVILNTNRNTYRKANDISIRAFLIFLKMTNMDSRVKMFLNCSLESPSGYDVQKLIDLECHNVGIDGNKVLNNHILTFSDKPDDEKMNYLYNACEVGINTCIGEGFGLCNIEHASVGKPQVVSKVCSFKDIFKFVGKYSYVEPVTRIYIPKHMDEHGGYVEYCNADDFAYRLYDIFNNYEKYIAKYHLFSNQLVKKYDWDTILDNFYKEFEV